MRRLAPLTLACALLGTACTPAKTPAAKAVRTGTTVRTNCPDAAPALADEGLETVGKPLGLTIERICVYGTSEQSRAGLDGALALHIGEPLAEGAVRASIDAIAKTGLFDDVSLGAEKRGDGALVHVIVKERPRVEEVVYVGASAAQMTSPVVYGTPLDPFVLHAAAQKIQREYRVHGWGAATVKVEAEPTTPGKVRVKMLVTEGAPWKIAKLAFTGNAKVKEADLRAASALTTGSAWNPEEADAASAKLTELYYDRGYLNVRLESPQRDVTADGAVTLTWTIAEGDTFTIDKIRFSGEPAEKLQNELNALLKTRTKTVFSRSALLADIARVRELFAKRGKTIEVTPMTKTDQKQKTIEVEIELKDAGGAH